MHTFTQGGMYLELFHGRTNPAEHMDDWGTPGPIFGPLERVQMTYTTQVRGWPTMPDAPVVWLHLDDDMLYYDGVWYGDWLVRTEVPARERERLMPFDPARAERPAR